MVVKVGRRENVFLNFILEVETILEESHVDLASFWDEGARMNLIVEHGGNLEEIHFTDG
jgi:hypothetical protein